MRSLFTTVVGSRAFGAETETSDWDLHEVYMVSLNELLREPFWHPRPKEVKADPDDIVRIEISSLIAQLIKGNFDAYITVMSPIIHYEDESGTLFKIRDVVKRNVAKNIYGSVVGFSHSMVGDYMNKGDVKRIRVARRILSFGINVLKTGEFIFNKDAEMAQISSEVLRTELAFAYAESTLPEKPNEEEYKDLLREIRLG